jgi:hypothetical protein
MHKDIQRFLVCNFVLVLYLTSWDLLDFVLRLLMANILYGRLCPDVPSLIAGWEKHFCDWLGGAFVRVSSHVFNMPALERNPPMLFSCGGLGATQAVLLDHILPSRQPITGVRSGACGGMAIHRTPQRKAVREGAPTSREI